jgi:membrane fusion protein (multidrug efflux system)
MKALGGAFLVAASLIVTGCSHGNSDNEANAPPPPTKVTVETVRRATVPITDDFEGSLSASERVEVRARVQGTLDSAPFKEGEIVRKGDLIFRIQQNEYVAALSAAQAQVGVAQAQVGQAKGYLFSREAALVRANTTVARDRPLAADQAIPQKDLDNAIQTAEVAKGDVEVARAQIASANAAVDAAQAAVDNAKISLGYTEIYAPVTGLIGFLNYDVGNVVGAPGTQVLDTITAIDPIKVNFSVDEATYLNLFQNRNNSNGPSLRDQDLSIILANDQAYPYGAHIYTYNPTIDPKTGTVTVEARIPNPEGLLRPGGFVRVRAIVERRSGALLVPQTAITKAQGVDSVYIVDDKNEAVLRSVTLGPEFQQSFVAQSGLNAGDRVIVEGTQKVQPGAKVVVTTR